MTPRRIAAVREERVDGRVVLHVEGSTAADLVAYLQARPDLAVEVVGRLRVAGPWQTRSGTIERHSAERAHIVASVVQDLVIGWLWCIDTTHEGLRTGNRLHGEAASRGEAQAAADAALVAAGWALAGGAR